MPGPHCGWRIGETEFGALVAPINRGGFQGAPAGDTISAHADRDFTVKDLCAVVDL
jgi:hypothetical protein